MLFAPYERYQYARAPLVEVICQLRFPTILSIGAKEPAEFQEAIRKDFPQYAARQEQLPPKVVKKGNATALEPQKPITNYNFISEDGRWKLNLTQGFIALSTLSYTRWEDFATRLDRPLALIKGGFELRAMCLAGYEPVLDACAVCGCQPEEPRFHLREGMLHCARCRSEVGDGVSMPLDQGALAAMRHVAYGDPKRLFSFQLEEKSLSIFADVAEAYLLTQLERGFRTLDFYKQMTRPAGPDR